MEQIFSKETYIRAAVLGPNLPICSTKIHCCVEISCLQCVLIPFHSIQNMAPSIVKANFNNILSCTLVSTHCYLLFMFLD
jgi:hypothetical protein